MFVSYKCGLYYTHRLKKILLVQICSHGYFVGSHSYLDLCISLRIWAVYKMYAYRPICRMNIQIPQPLLKITNIKCFVLCYQNINSQIMNIEYLNFIVEPLPFGTLFRIIIFLNNSFKN